MPSAIWQPTVFDPENGRIPLPKPLAISHLGLPDPDSSHQSRPTYQHIPFRRCHDGEPWAHAASRPSIRGRRHENQAIKQAYVT
jgi:hypothetical protein